MLIPVGAHVCITDISGTFDYGYLAERESFSMGLVLDVSPDLKVPFKKGDFVYFFSGNEINIEESVFLKLNSIVGFSMPAFADQ